VLVHGPAETWGKRIGLLKEALPKLSNVCIIMQSAIMAAKRATERIPVVFADRAFGQM
jgi:hypothetical protein